MECSDKTAQSFKHSNLRVLKDSNKRTSSPSSSIRFINSAAVSMSPRATHDWIAIVIA
jgi:hypothetical protein